jgi:peptide/nickel transport system permease protein
MRTYFFRRLGYSGISLFLLSITIFVAVRATGDPALLLVGPGGRPEDMQRAREDWGIDRSWPEQYLAFVANVARGDFGVSFQYRLPVIDLYLQRLPNSLQLAFAGLLVSLAIGLPLGLLTAVKVDTGWDTACKIFAMLGLSIPGFFVFAVGLRWLPAAGSGTPAHLIMPALALGWYFAASMLRLTRSGMLDVLGSEYVKLARLKGTPERVVIVKHAFKNALIPVLTLAGINFVVMLNVAVIIETIFAWPGIGRLLFEGISLRDFPVVQGVVVMAGITVLAVNLFVDLLYALIDPRIRYA